jgi:peptidyl-prolyl cis-trans isomerase SurA
MPYRNFLCLGLLLFFAISGLTAIAQPANTPPLQTIDRIIGRVDNYIILHSELEVAYLQALQSNERKQGDTRCKVLENLVINKLMLAKADIDSVTVDNKLVEDQLDRRMAYMMQQVGGKDKIEAYYHKTVDQLKNELRKSVKELMVVNKMQETITKDVKVTPAEVKKFFSDIPKDSVPYFSKEVEVGQIVMLPKINRAKKLEAKTTLQKIKDRILAGERFEDLAKKYSEDPGSGKEGGDLGMASKGMMVPEFEAAALKLKPGQLSEIIESQFGYHLIKLIERKGDQYHSRHILIKPTSSEADLEETARILDSLKAAILLDSISFEKAAKKFSEDAQTKNNGGFFTDATTNSTRIATENLDPVVYFVIDTMQPGEISRPMPVRLEDKEAMRILFFKSKLAPHEANLKDDYQKIYAATIMQKKNAALAKWFDKTRGEVFINVSDPYKNCELFQKGFQ